METICSGGTRQIRPNFSEHELYSKSPNAPECHPMSDITLDAIQAIREFWGVPASVTSTHRTATHNAAIGGSSASQHLGFGAIDLQPMSPNTRAEKMQALYQDLICKGPLYQSLRDMGVKGLGIYNTFVHVDDGTFEGNPRPFMQFWDMSAGNHGPIQMTTAYMATIPENGSPECGAWSPETIKKYGSKKKAS